MTFHYRYLIIFCIFLLNCISSNDPTSKITEGQSNILKSILRLNGFKITDDEWVDNYLEFFSSSKHADLQDQYILILPADGHAEIILDSNINHLNNMFQGISTHYQNEKKLIKNIDTLMIKSDSIINIKAIGIANCKLRTLPKNINLLRGRSFLFYNNHIKQLPENLINILDPPKLYNTSTFDFSGNSIDTTTISDTLDKWLQKYYTPYWKNTQVYE